MRNVTANIEKGTEIIKTRQGLDLSISETDVLFNSFQDRAAQAGYLNALFDTIYNSYKMGLAVGMRNAKKRGA